MRFKRLVDRITKRTEPLWPWAMFLAVSPDPSIQLTFDCAVLYECESTKEYRKGFNRNTHLQQLTLVEIILKKTVKKESGIRVQRRRVLDLSKELLIKLLGLQTLPAEMTSHRMAAPGRSEVLLGP